MSNRIALILAIAVSSWTQMAWSEPTNAILSLDALSFVADALDHGEQIPISAIPVRVESQSGSTWSLWIDPSDVQLPPVTLPNGDRLQWTLIDRATGSATFSDETATVTLSARFLAKSLTTSRQVEHRLLFTTERTETERGDLEVARDGYNLDRESGYVQLVASAADPPGSQHAIPFYVVLSGRFTSSPSGFLTE